MDYSIRFLLLLQGALIALNAVFASAEIAMLSINEAKLKRMSKQGNSRARRLLLLTQEPAKFLATIQVAITLSGFLGSAFAADNFSEPLVDWVLSFGIPVPRATLDTIAVILITLILSYITLIFGELVPKRIAMKKAESLALNLSGMIYAISIVCKPIVWFLSLSTNLVLRLCGIDPNEAEPPVSEEEIRMLIEAGSEKGTIAEQEKEFIQNVFEFNDTIVGEIATHRTDVVMLWLEDDISVWAKTIHENRHTHYPVCDGSPDHIIGILNTKDYFRLPNQTKDTILSTAMQPAYFILDTMKADAVFRSMKAEKHEMAVIVDEHGGMVGVVTLFDFIEELVGTFEPCTAQNSAPSIEPINAHTWQISGNLALCEIEAATGIRIAAQNHDTITGLVFHTLGMIPDEGTQNIDLEIQNMNIHITNISGHQIQSATLQLHPPK